MKLLLELLCSYLLLSEMSAFPEVYELYEKRVNTPAPPHTHKKKSEQIDAEEANNLHYYPIFILHITLLLLLSRFSRVRLCATP